MDINAMLSGAMEGFNFAELLDLGKPFGLTLEE